MPTLYARAAAIGNKFKILEFQQSIVEELGQNVASS
jgi:hypothetical protein